MKYYTSEHFRDDPAAEVDSALAFNSLKSVMSTLESRLLTEESYSPRDEREIDRLQQQLAHLALLSSNSEAAA